MDEKSIDDDDLRRIIEKAHMLSQAEQQRLTLDDVKKTAEELGISDEKINLAYELLEKEKLELLERKARLRAQRTQYITVGVILSVIIAFIVYNSMPKPVPPLEPFKGKILKMTLAENVENFTPIGEVKEVKLFQQIKIFSHVRLNGVFREHILEWRFITPTGELFDSNSVKLKPTDGGTTSAWAAFNLPLSMPLGDWKMEILVDSSLVESYPVKVDYGHFDVKMVSKLGTGDKKTPDPADVKNVFSKANTKIAFCYLYWDLISAGRAGELAWSWIGPDGKEAQNAVVKISPNTKMSWHRANHGLELKDAAVGKWKIEIKYADIVVKEVNFEVTP